MAGGKNHFDPTKALKPGQITRTRQHIKDYAKTYCEDMVNVLYDIAQDKTNYARDRIAAAEAIINRGYGRPVDQDKVDNDFGNVVDVQKLTTAQLQAMITELHPVEDAEIVPALPAPTDETIAVEVADALIDRIEDA